MAGLAAGHAGVFEAAGGVEGAAAVDDPVGGVAPGFDAVEVSVQRCELLWRGREVIAAAGAAGGVSAVAEIDAPLVGLACDSVDLVDSRW